MEQLQPLEKAIRAVGNQSVLAQRIGASQQQISHWKRKLNGLVPAEYAIPIEKATEGEISRYELRPDIYPKDDCPCRSKRRKKS